ncbi:hypothetical protein SUDANB140_02533 [Streptomyces sp. enrichment culture]
MRGKFAQIEILLKYSLQSDGAPNKWRSRGR